MTHQSDMAELDRLANEGARLLRGDPRAAAVNFEDARAIALRLGDRPMAASLSVLAARAVWREGRMARSLRLAQRAIMDAPSSPLGHDTLARLCEYAAQKQRDASKRIRARSLYRAASAAYAEAAKLVPSDEERAALEKLAESAQRLADA